MGDEGLAWVNEHVTQIISTVIPDELHAEYGGMLFTDV